MWNRLLALLLLVTLPAGLGAAEVPGYRVAGVVRQGDAWPFAIVVAPDGTSRVLGRGEALGDAGTIVAITAQGITVQKEAATYQIDLQGALYSSWGPAGAPTMENLELSREVQRGDMAKRLASARSRASSAARPLTSGEANELLSLPPQVTITNINGTPVQKGADVLEIVQAALDGGGMLRIFVDGIEGVRNLYVMLRDEKLPQ